MKERIVWLTIMVMCLAVGAAQAQGFGTPAGGWFYIQEFDSDLEAQTPAWYRDNDEWDGSAPGEAGTAPGGAVFLTEGATTYLRIQDPGHPEKHSAYSDPSNRKIKWWLDLEDAGLTAAQGDTLLDDGVTLVFRTRIATTGILDDFYHNDGSTVTSWPATGDGHQIHNSGNAMFNIHQKLPVNSGDDDGDQIGFSLVTVPDLQRTFANDGLTMNSLNGEGPKGDVDSGEGTQNLSAEFDPRDWHEFWITIIGDTSGGGSHKVTVYMDGDTTPFGTFHVTGGWDDTSGEKGAFINIGSTNSDESAAWDTDFMAVGLGVILPVPGDPDFNPPPTCSAGPDQVGYYPEDNPFELSGSWSDAGPINPAADGSPGGIVSSAWTLEDGPDGGIATFDPVDTNLVMDPNVTFSGPGVYVLELTVYDGNSVPQEANDIVVITVRDHADDFLVGYWPMDNSLVDVINANDGTGYGLSGDMAAHELAGDKAVLSAVTYSTDGAIPGSTASLSLVNPDNDEPNQYVCVGDAPQLDDLSVPAEFTVSAWVKMTEDQTDKGPRVIMSKGGDGDDGVRWMLKVSNGSARIITDDNSNKQTATGGAIDDGLWHFVVGTVKLDAIAIYVDGIQRDDDTGMGPNYDLSGSSQRQAFIGAATRVYWPDPSEPNYPNTPGGEGSWIPATEPNEFNITVDGGEFVYDAKVWDGLLDEIKVYNYALPLDDPTYLDILDLAAEGELPADVDAGDNRTVELQRPIVLVTEGTSTDNGIPGTLIYEWTTLSRPALADANAVFTDPAALVTDVEFPEFGDAPDNKWVLQLTVFDVNLGIITDTSTVTLTLISPDCSDVIAGDLLLTGDISGPDGTPDCHIDLYDIAAFAADFGRCNDPQGVGCEDPWEE